MTCQLEGEVKMKNKYERKEHFCVRGRMLSRGGGSWGTYPNVIGLPDP